MVHGIADIGQRNRQHAAGNGQQCFSAFCLFSYANLLIINSLRYRQSYDFLPQRTQRISQIVLNQDFNKIIKMNRIIKNLANLENLMKIVVQDKINHSSDKIKK